jgi:hypothetical protein
MHRSPIFVRVILSVLIVLGPGVSLANGSTLRPGDILVTESGALRHYSASGADLGIFAAELATPSWLATDNGGNIYVSEYTGNRIRKFSPSGVDLLTITTTFIPGGVAVDTDGVIYVGDYFGGNVYRYSSAGAALGLFVSTGLSRADFLRLDEGGNLYITDFFEGVVRRISPSGVDLGNFVNGFPAPEGLAFDAADNLYVASFSTGIIRKYSPSGTDLGPFAPAGSGFYGLDFDGAGNLYSSVTSSGAIEKFSPGGAALGAFGTSGRDLVVVPPGGPTTKDECKHGGWVSFDFPRAFKNQGDCVQFVETGK